MLLELGLLNFSHPQLGSSSSTKEKRCSLPQKAPLVDNLPFLGKPLRKQKEVSAGVEKKAGTDNI